MNFNQLEYLFLLLICILGTHILRSNTLQKILLLIVSLYFYAWVDVRFLPLLLAYVFVTYGTMLALKYQYKFPNKLCKYLCYVAITLLLGILALFKYTNFLLETIGAIFRKEPIIVHIFLPLGISFITFQCISLIVDVYKGKEIPCGLIDTALIICFFPKLTAGPIVRLCDIRTQLVVERRLQPQEIYYGLRQFTIGLFQKILIADHLSSFVDKVFDNYAVFDYLTLWVAAFCYTIQIYCDFCGYSNMAIGSARMLGFHINENFDWPYLSQNITEFWRRWHISLSYWLRDYVYIPLGGNRKGKMRSYFNQLLTMVLGGLWHGANWTFIVWGIWHGLLLCSHKFWLQKRNTIHPTNTFIRSSCIILTLFCVMLGWIIFRANTCQQAYYFIKGMFLCQKGIFWCNPFHIGIILLVVFWHFLKKLKLDKFMELPYGSLFSYTILFTMLWLIVLFQPVEFTPFVYGNF